MINLKDFITRHEGRDPFPYLDSVGKLTIGVGHNIEDLGLSDNVIDLILKEDLERATSQLKRKFPWMGRLDHNRLVAVIDMTHNLGINRFSMFKKFLKALKRKDWNTAADEAIDSKWAKQVGSRAIEIADIIRYGDL